MKRDALLVLGMHRSGTSAVAGLLARVGARPPKTLMAADAHNPEGYWESSVLCEFHDRLLHAAGSRWNATGHLDGQWCRAQATADLGSECRDLLRAEYEGAPMIVIKDPRICRFVPFWLRILEIEGLTSHAVIVHRDPLEVVDSLSARNGFDRDFSIALWLRHVLDAEFETRGVRQTLVRYRTLLDDWRGVVDAIERDLRIEWPARSPAIDEDIQRFVNRDRRHHDAKTGVEGVTPTLADWLRRTSSALDRLEARHPEVTSAASSDLDAVRLEFDRVAAISEPRLQTLERQIDGLQAELLRIRAEQDRVKADLGRLCDERDALRADRDRLRERATDLERQVHALHADRDRLSEWATDLERQAHALEVHSASRERALADSRKDAAELRASLSWRMTSPLRVAGRFFK